MQAPELHSLLDVYEQLCVRTGPCCSDIEWQPSCTVVSMSEKMGMFPYVLGALWHLHGSMQELIGDGDGEGCSTSGDGLASCIHASPDGDGDAYDVEGCGAAQCTMQRTRRACSVVDLKILHPNGKGIFSFAAHLAVAPSFDLDLSRSLWCFSMAFE